MRRIRTTAGKTCIIPHGIDERFACPPRRQLPISAFSNAHPLRILYVSIIDVYKHQWHVAEAVAQLRARGLPVTLELVGPAYPPAMQRLRQTMSRVDPAGEFVSYAGTLPHDALPQRYAGADIFLFASSCETFGQILLEVQRRCFRLVGLEIGGIDLARGVELLRCLGRLAQFSPAGAKSKSRQHISGSALLARRKYWAAWA